MKLTKIYVVTEKDDIEPLGVFTKKYVADDFLKNEYPRWCETRWCEIQTRIGIVNGDVAYILDPRIPNPWEIGDNYTSEYTRKRNELQASALAKLTSEEMEALGVI